MEAIAQKYFDNGKRISVYYDCDTENPREWDNMAHFILKPGFGDESDVRGWLEQLCEDYGVENYEERPWLELINELSNYIVIKPVSMYEHSGATIFFGAPNDRWDSGYIGFAYIERADLDKYGNNESKREDWRKAAESYLNDEMETLDKYVRGEVYGFVEEEQDEDGDWNETDSCWGFFESPDELIEDVIARRA